MSLQFQRVRGRDGPSVEEAMQDWLASVTIDEIENLTVHQDKSGYTVYSVFYRGGGEE